MQMGLLREDRGNGYVWIGVFGPGDILIAAFGGGEEVTMRNIAGLLGVGADELPTPVTRGDGSDAALRYERVIQDLRADIRDHINANPTPREEIARTQKVGY